MATYATELFVQCVYSIELSYDELLEVENDLKVSINAILESNGAEYIHFEPLGDTMRVQCVFVPYGETIFHPICDAIAPLMDGRVEARLFFISKNVEGAHFYTVSKGDWAECVVQLPPAGPITDALLRQAPQGTGK